MPEAVVSNTSPSQYLHQLGLLDLLPHFYRQITIPQGVQQELAVGRSLGVELPDLTTLSWVQICPTLQAQPLSLASTLGVGEREVLALALEMADPLVIMDDGRARRIGRLLDLRMTGSIGVLARGVREGIIFRLSPLLDQLESLGFRLSTEARAAALRLVGEGF